MSKFNYRDARDIQEFDRAGYHYRKVEGNEEYILWKMEREGISYSNYELWLRINAKNPDGSVVWRKPSDEDFGRYAWYICGNEEKCQMKIKGFLARFRASVV